MVVIAEGAPMIDAIATEIMTKRNATAERTIRGASGEEMMKNGIAAIMTEASAEMMMKSGGAAIMSAKTT